MPKEHKQTFLLIICKKLGQIKERLYFFSQKVHKVVFMFFLKEIIVLKVFTYLNYPNVIYKAFLNFYLII